MAKMQLLESVTEAPVKSGNLWRVIVARPGKGSSGTYSAELFERDAEKLIPAGAQAYLTHDNRRNPEKMLGTYPAAAHWDAQEQAVVANLNVFSHWKEWVEEVGPHCGISLSADGEVDDEGNVTEIFESVHNGADLVDRAGLAGSGFAEKLYEAALAASSLKETGNPPGNPTGKETKDMDEAKVAELVGKAVADAIAPLVSAQDTKAKEAAQVEVDRTAVSEAVEAYDKAVKAIDEADLIPEQVTALKAEAKTGVDITAKIAEAKATKEAIEKHLTESADTTGRIKTGETAPAKYGYGA